MAKPRTNERDGVVTSATDPDAPGEAFEAPPSAPDSGSGEQPPELPASSTELLSPTEWGKRKGKVRPPAQPWLGPVLDPIHAAADQAFGWTRDVYNYQPPTHTQFVLSEADYDACLESAGAHPNVPLHEAGFPKRT
jgi:hypothetical protein